MTTLEQLERQVLISCYGLVHDKRQALASMGRLLKISGKWMLLSWLYRECPQYGSAHGWTFFFHGYDCDLKNIEGTNIIADVGSLGYDDSFSRWGIAEFVASSGRSRFVLPELRTLVRQESSERHVLINEEPISVACDRLLDLGYLERRPSVCSIANIPEAIVSRYSIAEDHFIFSIRRECLALTARGIEQVASEHGFSAGFQPLGSPVGSKPD